MATNEERRKVAARLRTLASHAPADEEMVLDALDLYPGEFVEGFDPECVRRLADLIEPEPERTCRIVRESVDRGGDRMTDYSCGCFNTEGWNHSYCPSCGAKVVE